MRPSLLLSTLSAASAALLSGCAGSGASSSIVVPPTTTLVQIQQGWTWTDSASGTFTPTAGVATPFSGSRTTTCTSRVGTVVIETEATNLNVGGTPHSYSKTIVYNQAADGTLTLVSVTVGANPTETVQTTTFAIPSPLTSSTNVSGQTTYTDAIVETDQLFVTGQLLVSTPIASFYTWTSTYTEVYNGVQVVNETQQRVPGIAHPAQSTGTAVVKDGTFTGTFTLNSTNVPLPTM